MIEDNGFSSLFRAHFDRCEAAKDVVDLYDVEDLGMLEAVEGDAILQTLLGVSTPRAGRSFPRRQTLILSNFDASDHDEELCKLDEEVSDEDTYDTPVEDTEVDVVGDNLPLDVSFSSSTILQRFGVILVGISIVITWPVGIAYLFS